MDGNLGVDDAVGANVEFFFTCCLFEVGAIPAPPPPPAVSRGDRSSDGFRSLKDVEPQFVSRPN